MVEFQLPKLTARVRFPSPAPYVKATIAGYAICAVLAVLMSGCATVEEYPTQQAPVKAPVPAPSPAGVYHKVQKGQTLWRIAKSYNVALEDLIKSNNIPNGATLETDQLLLIPGAKDVKAVDASAPDAKSDDFQWPVRGQILAYFSDARGGRDNRGIDIAAAQGDTVRAARDGRVVFADTLNGYAGTVVVDHLDGFYSVYAFNDKLMVTLGQTVAKGAPLATIGRFGPKVFEHFEIRRNAESHNPLFYLP